jgi:aspartate 1-decarboxylase
MRCSLLRAKIQNARVTASNLEYDGSLTIDRDVMDAVKLVPYEKILVANLENGNRFETYAIPGESGTGMICLNGAAAYMGKIGDRLIIMAFTDVAAEDAIGHRPLIIRLDARNRPDGGLLPV